MLYYFQDYKVHNLIQHYVEQETPYHYQDILGIGGYGVAYLLTHKETKQKYVLKRLKSKHKNRSSSRQKFQLEIAILKKLHNSSYFPSFITEGEIKNVPFYIMEYVEGQTFEQAIFNDGVTFSLSQSLVITKQLLEIVIFMHHQEIVHRDLRIPNILIKDNKLRVIDFGLAAYLKEDVSLSEIHNPKKAENHVSDLYFVGHFLLFLLYSNYTPTKHRERSWQEELQLPPEVTEYIERLLLIRPVFPNAQDALNSVPLFTKKIVPSV